MRIPRIFQILLVALALTGVLVWPPTPAAAAPTGLAATPGLSARAIMAVARSLVTPDADPDGANDWQCKPTVQRPRPVVLVHGTWMNALNNWAALSPSLKDAGYCVFAVNYGAPSGSILKATDPVPQSARQIAAFVDRVLAATGADQVDLVGYSQGGGLLPRWYLKHEGGGEKVARLIGIAPSNHGTDLSGLVTLGESLRLMGITGRFVGQSALDQARGSDVHGRLDSGGDTVPGIEYTTIVTTADSVLTPYRNQYLTAGPGAKVTNHTLQSYCPRSWTGHVAMPFDRAVTQLVHTALDPTDRRVPQCGVFFSFL
ncbi:esterase/lipase family protein [Streptomyces noursei]|uniref:esterase/lipase family protein n=1 Tax=Streptomyces TaxID=1883 RepID=UPI0035D6E815